MPETYLKVIGKYYEETINGFNAIIGSVNEFIIPYVEYINPDNNVVYLVSCKDRIEQIIWLEYENMFNHLPSYGLFGSYGLSVELVVQIGRDDDIKGILVLIASFKLPENILFKPEPNKDTLEYYYETFIYNICAIDEGLISLGQNPIEVDLNRFLLDEYD